MSEFENVLSEYKEQTKPMCEALDCLDLLDDFLVDIELSRAKYHHFYQAGQQSQQAKIDELQARIDEAVKYIEPSDEISHKAYRDLMKILKGKEDERPLKKIYLDDFYMSKYEITQNEFLLFEKKIVLSALNTEIGMPIGGL